MIVYAIKNHNQYVCTDSIGFIDLKSECLTTNIFEAFLFISELAASNQIDVLKALDKSPYNHYTIVKVEIKEVKNDKG